MQSQDSPPHHLRNVPAFRDLRIGSPKSWRSSFRRSIGETNSDIYELIDPPGTRSNQTTTPYQSDFNLPRQADTKQVGVAISTDTFVGCSEIPRGEGLAGSSEDAGTQKPCRRVAILKELWFPLFCIHSSMLLVLGTLAVLVSVYRVKADRGLFFDPTGFDDSTEKAYILLSIPASTKHPHLCRGSSLTPLQHS